ncbi:TPA: hypothetical protein ACYLK1_006312, partial [Burkholderia cenocepacia]
RPRHAGTPPDHRAPQRLRPFPLAGGYVKVRHVLPKPAVSMPQSPQTVAGAACPTRAVPGVPGDTPESGCRPRESRRPIRAPRRTGANPTMTIHGAPLPAIRSTRCPDA